MSSHLSDTHIYLDLQIVNNNQNNNEPPPVLRFEETRNSPFLPGDSADYFCSILRFSVETGDEIPVFIPRIELGESQMDVNKTVYRVTVEHNGVSKTVPLIWDPIDLSVEPPQPPMLKQNIMSRYYYMTNFSQFLPMINNALKEAWSIVGSEKNNSPFLDFDPETSKFNINSDVEYITKGTKLYFNSRLYELLSSFPAKFIEYKGDKNYRIEFYNNHELHTKPIFKPSTSGKCQVIDFHVIQMFQEIITIGLWSPVASIVFTSSLLPIKSTNTSPPRVFTDTTVGNALSSSGQPNLANIITDFEVAISEKNQYRPDISFRIESEYRLVDMYSMPNLNRIDISVFWLSCWGDYVPLHLVPGAMAQIKVLFRNRSFN